MANIKNILTNLSGVTSVFANNKTTISAMSNLSRAHSLFTNNEVLQSNILNLASVVSIIELTIANPLFIPLGSDKLITSDGKTFYSKGL